jgi:predicted metal-binding protein
VSTLFVCVTCRREGDAPAEPRPGARLHAGLKEQAGDIDVVGVECLSNCERGCTAAVGAPGKWTYIVGRLDPDQHVADLLAFARLHDQSADGLTVWRDRPIHVRKNTIARVPPLKEMS